MHTLLLVEDDPQAVKLFKPFLVEEGYRVLVAQTGAEALKKLERNKVQLIIVDLMLPDIFGSDLCAKLREQTTTPILILSSSKENQDYIDSLNMGADGIAQKTMELDIIAAKIYAIIRRNELEKKGAIDIKAPEIDSITFSGWTLLPSAQKAISPTGVTLKLTTTDTKLLVLFCRNANKALSRDTIAEMIGIEFDEDIDFSRSVDTAVCRLRKKLARLTPDVALIATVRHKGYKFLGVLADGE